MIKFSWHPFSELTVAQLYNVLALRSEVFVVDQNCVYHDPDGKDFYAIHLLGMENESLCAYARLFVPTENNQSVVFGRVVTANHARNKGYGKKLIREIINYCETHFQNITIKCSAQLYLQKFYESFGFKVTGDAYDEDNIPHIAMKKEY